MYIYAAFALYLYGNFMMTKRKVQRKVYRGRIILRSKWFMLDRRHTTVSQKTIVAQSRFWPCCFGLGIKSKNARTTPR